MKYILIALLLFPFFASAEVPSGVFGFMDNKFYDADQSLKYMCFGDGNCYDMEQKFAFKREVKGTATDIDVPKFLNATYWLDSSLGYLKQSIGFTRGLTQEEKTFLLSSTKENSINVFTDEPVILRVSITNNGITEAFDINDLSNFHSLSYDSLKVKSGVFYTVEIGAIDKSLNYGDVYKFSGILKR